MDADSAIRADALQLPSPLRDYQWEGVSFLFRAEGALLADEMGLGKTVQAAVALSLLLREPGYDRALIVAPSSLVLNWERELHRWAPELSVRRVSGNDAERHCSYLLPIPVLIASYEQVRMDAFDNIPEEAFDVVLLDEAQRVKNKDSRTALACRLLPRKRSWALTATPVENRREDLESIFSFATPGLLAGVLSRDELLERVRPHLLRRRKSTVLASLPPVILEDVYLQLLEEQRAAYENAWAGRLQQATESGRPVSTATLFALLTRLKQICNYDSDTDASCKLEALRDVLDSTVEAGDKVLLFSQYVESLRWLAPKLGIDPLIYHGQQSQEERDAVLAEFNDSPGPQVLLMSLKAGGVGLNIQSADVVVLFDRWWNPAVEYQAIYRAHRFDRKSPLHVLRFLVEDTVEDRIEKILQDKEELFREYVDEAPTTEVKLLTRGELLRVLDLQPSETN